MKIGGVDLNTLDMKDAGMWPPALKRAAWAAAAIAAALLTFYFTTRPAMSELSNLQYKQAQLLQKFKLKQAQAANLPDLKAQMKQMRVLLANELRQLPNKTQMPTLVIDISQAATGNGIKIEKFKPEPEIVKNFYAIQPIAIRMEGDYSQFGAFLGDVAALPRVVIMTPQAMVLQPVAQVGAGTQPVMSTSGNPMLVLEGTVETYRALDANELAARAAAAQAAAAAKIKTTAKPVIKK